MIRHAIMAGLVLACVVGPANARGSGKASRPDGLTGNHSRTFNYTTGTYRAWSETGGKRGAVTVYPHSIEAKTASGGHSRAASRASLDALAASHMH